IMDEFASLTKARGRVKAKLTAFGNFITSLSENPERKIELPSRLEKAEVLWTEFESVPIKIEDLDDSYDPENPSQYRNEFENTYYELISKGRQLISKEHSTHLLSSTINDQPAIDHPDALTNNPNAVRSVVKLPNIDLPKFDDDYEQWIPFRDMFESLIASNTALSPVQKLHYLRSALSSKALKIISTLEITNASYEVAWNLLKQRFEKKKLIVQCLVQRLLELVPINKESHIELRKMVDNISQYMQMIAKMEQPIQSWGTLLICIILPKIYKATRREWQLKRSSIDELSTLQEFLDFLLERSTFLEKLAQGNRNTHTDARTNSKQNQAKNVSQAHVTANKPGNGKLLFKTCPICSKEHKVHACKVFFGMLMDKRINVIKQNRLCNKCSKRFFTVDIANLLTYKMWIHWKSQIVNIQAITIPRQVTESCAIKIELHGFAPKKAKTVLSAGKEKGKTITGTYYASLLDKLKAEIEKKRPHLKKKKVLFHQDNAPSHTSAIAMAKIRECIDLKGDYVEK
ncbi:hypothetical protein ALC57_01238, partial [Trachymyrmex cornetzi]